MLISVVEVVPVAAVVVAPLEVRGEVELGRGFGYGGISQVHQERPLVHYSGACKYDLRFRINSVFELKILSFQGRDSLCNLHVRGSRHIIDCISRKSRKFAFIQGVSVL